MNQIVIMQKIWGEGFNQAEYEAEKRKAEAAADLLKCVEDILYAHDMAGNGASNNYAVLNHQLSCQARHVIAKAKGE